MAVLDSSPVRGSQAIFFLLSSRAPGPPSLAKTRRCDTTIERSKCSLCLILFTRWCLFSADTVDLTWKAALDARGGGRAPPMLSIGNRQHQHVLLTGNIPAATPWGTLAHLAYTVGNPTGRKLTGDRRLRGSFVCIYVLDDAGTQELRAQDLDTSPPRLGPVISLWESSSPMTWCVHRSIS